ncbi:hypothetical protein [Paraburkholderia phytofirmans]|jgi:hypothetical protein|uniref:hypothetical protein n=1 Tax=Paraburkholderia TaxID=1822464 RepID=UPI001314628F|nr:hypothetical protein [Paraburkholderia phytofirmans]
MEVSIYNEGEHSVRAVVDRDTINDSPIDAGLTDKLGTPGGIIELCELKAGADEVRAS